MNILIEGNCRTCLDYIEAQFPGLQATAANLNVESGPLIFEDTHFAAMGSR